MNWNAFFEKFLVTSILAVSCSPAFANTKNEDVDYGELYVVETRTETPSQWAADLSYAYGFSNPYLHVHGLDLGIQRKITPFFGAGLQGEFFYTTTKRLATFMEANLASENAETKIYRPQTSIFAMGSLIPLSGMLNWFGGKPVDFDLRISLGPGVSKFSDIGSLVPSFRGSINPEVMLTERFGMMVGFDGIYDLLPGNFLQSRMSASAGVISRF